MKRRELLSGLAATALVSGCASQAPSRARTSLARYGSPVPLPSPALTGTISLETAIGKRRSLRAFRPDPLPMATIGQLLWAGQPSYTAPAQGFGPCGKLDISGVRRTRCGHSHGHRAAGSRGLL